MSFYSRWKFLLRKKFLFSLVLHSLHGFLFEKSKLYYPYSINRTILLYTTDLYKFYISSCFIFLGIPYIFSKISPNKYVAIHQSIENRYRNRTVLDLQIGSYLSGLAMICTGFCPAYLPVYLAISPGFFLYSISISYGTFTFYHVFSRLFANRGPLRPVIQGLVNSTPIAPDRDVLYNIGRIALLSIGIILLFLFELIEQSLPVGHSGDDLVDLIMSGDYFPPGLTGLFCGVINFLLIFICDEYQTYTSEWLINIFYYSSESSLKQTVITGQVCSEQTLKILAMSFGVHLSLWTSERQEIPKINWLYYLSTGLGSVFSALSMCLTTASFNDHIYSITAYVGYLPTTIIVWTIASAWYLLYLAKLIGL